MNEEDVKKVAKLIANKKNSEAKAIIASWLDTPVSAEEKGAALAEEALANMQVTNEINEEYLHIMEEVLALSKQANIAAHSIDMQQRIGKIRSRIKDL